jgi:3-oxoacyl-[acyl-carrier-protein] synthase II
MNRVVVTGLGAISAIGNSPAALFAAALYPRSGIRQAPELAIDGSVPLVASADFDASGITPRQRTVPLDRATAMALAAARQATADAAAETILASPRAGIYWGTGMGAVTTLEDSYRALFINNQVRLKPTSIVTGMNNAPAALISLEFGVTGPVLTYSVACASSAIAIGEALRAIRHGVVDCAVAGGSDAMLTPGMLVAWSGLRTLAATDSNDPSRSCKPFALDRSGFVLGEGAAAIILENAESAAKRGATIYAELVGFGQTSDATHITEPSSDGQVRAIEAALCDAGVDPSEIGYINAHGTATMVGDRVEVESIRRVFGDAASNIPVSSTKALHGHVMGATGVIEFVIALLAMQSGSLPPTANLDRTDPTLELDLVANVARHGANISAIVSNSFAFGGSNAVLVARNAVAAKTSFNA